MREAEKLVNMKIHPMTIIAGDPHFRRSLFNMLSLTFKIVQLLVTTSIHVTKFLVSDDTITISADQ